MYVFHQHRNKSAKEPAYGTCMDVDSDHVMPSFDVLPQLMESSIEDDAPRQCDDNDMQLMVVTYENNTTRNTERKQKN